MRNDLNSVQVAYLLQHKNKVYCYIASKYTYF